MKIVISQPMFFPWVGMLEQIRLADCYVNYDDVQFSKGSFVNRVQIKTAAGVKWMTVPLRGVSLGQSIAEVAIDNQKNWQHQHLQTLRQSYAAAPFLADMLAVVQEVHGQVSHTIGELSERSLMALCAYFGLDQGRRFVQIRDLGILGHSSQRVLDIVKRMGGDHYITGLGASKYLDHAIFEDAGVRVEYMAYRKEAYPQLHGEFTPYVSALDLIANAGKEGAKHIASGTIYWREFLNHE